MAGWPVVYRAAAELIGCHKLPICNDPRLYPPAIALRRSPPPLYPFAHHYIFYSAVRNVDGG
jgi:hypothetical protein